jgi:hypothetical protein
MVSFNFEPWNAEDHDRQLRYFLTNAVALHRLLREYINGKEAGQNLQEKA